MKVRNVFSQFLLAAAIFSASGGERPNILWLTSEDHGPHMGCYGDQFATTPHADRLAAMGLLYSRAWSSAPVCAPARTTLISGLYPTSSGSEHMRSMVAYPAGKRMFPQFLRERGYYCSNNAKEDYNLEKPGQVWDESSRNAHWKNRKSGQPFFAVFNSEKSHESKLRVRPHRKVHPPAKVRVPEYHPDTLEVREDWAQYYDTVTAADADAGARLAELQESGLSEDTIIFYFADHGSGMPRSKRWPYNSGLQVPLIVYIPEKFKELRPPEYKAGGRSERLVSFVDFGPAVLSLAGIRPPDWMQGHAFLGQFQTSPQPFAHGFRGRMDERYDLVRSVTDGRYIYIRNYLPHLSYGQHIDYMFQTPTTRVWKKLYDQGKLRPPKTFFWQPKPSEELYDLQNDRDEVQNLADSPMHFEIKRKLRRAQQELAAKIRDVGFVPEGERLAQSKDSSPYDFARDARRYPFEQIIEIAELASMRQPEALPRLQAATRHVHSTIRYWAVLGMLMQGAGGIRAGRSELAASFKDSSAYVRIVAAQAFAQFGTDQEAKEALNLLIAHADGSQHDLFITLQALASLDALGAKAAPVAAQIEKLEAKEIAPHPRFSTYLPRMIEHLQARFQKDSL